MRLPSEEKGCRHQAIRYLRQNSKKKRYEHENTWQLIKIDTLLNYLEPEGFCEILKAKLTWEYFRPATEEFFILLALFLYRRTERL